MPIILNRQITGNINPMVIIVVAVFIACSVPLPDDKKALNIRNGPKIIPPSSMKILKSGQVRSNFIM